MRAPADLPLQRLLGRSIRGFTTAVALAGAIAYAAPAAGNPWTVRQPRSTQDVTGGLQPGPLPLRVYEGFGTLGPVHGHDDGAVSLDARPILVRCANGTTVVSAIDIGGNRYQLDTAGCQPVASPASAATGRPALRCDARTWQCRSASARAPAAPSKR